VLMAVHLLRMYILYLGRELCRMRNNKMAAMRIFFFLGGSFMVIASEPL